MEYWSNGVRKELEYWSTGVLQYWNNRVVEHWINEKIGVVELSKKLE